MHLIVSDTYPSFLKAPNLMLTHNINKGVFPTQHLTSKLVHSSSFGFVHKKKEKPVQRLQDTVHFLLYSVSVI